MKRIVGALILGAAISTLVPTHAAEPLPITDTHLHYSHDAWEVFPTEAAIALLREAGLKRAFVSPSSDEGTQRLYKAAPGPGGASAAPLPASGRALQLDA